MAVRADPSLFDENYYLVAYNEVAESPLASLFHFCVFGRQEGRNPNAYFDTGWYAATNPDVTPLRVNPLVHYLLVGEARSAIGRLFRTGWYRQTYGLTPQESPLAHFLAHRYSQRVSANSLFDAEWFVTQIGRKLHRRRDPFAHYLFAGTWEDLQPSRRFDAIAWRKRTRLRHRMVTLAPCPSGGGTESPLQTEFTTVVLGPAHGRPPHSGQRPTTRIAGSHLRLAFDSVRLRGESSRDGAFVPIGT